MIHRIKEAFPNPNDSKLNLDIMEHRKEKPLEEYVVNSFKSISTSLKEITLIDHSFVDDVDKVNLSSYERTRSNRQTDIEQKYTSINKSHVGELTMRFKVDLQGNHLVPSDKEPYLYYTVRLLIPIADEYGRLFLKGVRYPMQYQLTERSTYVTPGALVTKALMGIKLSKEKVDVRDHLDNLYTLNSWNVNMFNGVANALYFFFAQMGWSDTLEFFNLGDVIFATEEDDRDPDFTYFKIDPPLYLKVRNSMLYSPLQSYIQGIVGTIISACGGKMTMDELTDKATWVAKIGATKRNAPKESRCELGLRYRILFNRMLDESSIESYELTEYNKKDILHIIRWMIQENGPLRSKDNLDIMWKRLRRYEYMGSMINGVISERIKKFVNTTAKTWERLIKKYDDFFSYKGNEVISRIHKSGLAKWDDCVNDLDVFNRFKVTMKGPNAIGNKNPRNISAKQRALHPSHIGIIGLDVCSTSDPGLTNYINPLCETDGLYFKGRPPEPETFLWDWYDIVHGTQITETPNNDGTSTVAIQIVDPVKLNNIRDIADDIHICYRTDPRRKDG